MKTGNMYIIKRDGKNGAIAPWGEPLPTDEVVEVRLMLVADEGKVLVKDGEIIGQCVWLKDGDSQDNYTEIDEPVEPEPEEEPEEENIAEAEFEEV